MPNHMALRSQIAKLFLEELHLDVPSPDSDLMEAGILDSLAFVDLLMGLEREFEIDIAFDSIEVDNFRSVAKIAEFIGEHGATKMEPSVNEASLAS